MWIPRRITVAWVFVFFLTSIVVDCICTTAATPRFTQIMVWVHSECASTTTPTTPTRVLGHGRTGIKTAFISSSKINTDSLG